MWPLALATELAAAAGLGRWLRHHGGHMDSPIYHHVRSECVRSAAYERIGHFGDEDFEEWDRELAYEGEA